MAIVVEENRGTLKPMKSALPIPSGYPELLQELKNRIRGAQVRQLRRSQPRAGLALWSIGRDILVHRELKAGEPGSSTGWPRISKTSFLGSRASAFAPSGICGPLPKPGRRPKILQQVAAILPWGHHMVLLDRLKDPGLAFGTFMPRSSTAGVVTCWPFTSKSNCGRGKGRP